MVGIQPETEEERNDPAYDPFRGQFVSFEFEKYVVEDRGLDDPGRQDLLFQQQQERRLQELRAE